MHSYCINESSQKCIMALPYMHDVFVSVSVFVSVLVCTRVPVWVSVYMRLCAHSAGSIPAYESLHASLPECS